MKGFNSIGIQRESFGSHQLFIDMMHYKRQQHNDLLQRRSKALTLRNA